MWSKSRHSNIRNEQRNAYEAIETGTKKLCQRASAVLWDETDKYLDLVIIIWLYCILCYNIHAHMDTYVCMFVLVHYILLTWQPGKWWKRERQGITVASHVDKHLETYSESSVVVCPLIVYGCVIVLIWAYQSSLGNICELLKISFTCCCLVWFRCGIAELFRLLVIWLKALSLVVCHQEIAYFIVGRIFTTIAISSQIISYCHVERGTSATNFDDGFRLSYRRKAFLWSIDSFIFLSINKISIDDCQL